MGKPGAGICPVRGHSNVQGQRTVGITEKPELAPLDALEKRYGFSPPRDKGLNTVEACEGVLKGTVTAFIGLGGNFIRAVPETTLLEEYAQAAREIGMSASSLLRVVEMGFQNAFATDEAKAVYMKSVRAISSRFGFSV